MPATTQANNKTFSFIKDDVKNHKSKDVQKKTDKHGSLICIKNMRQGQSTSQSSKSRKPQITQ